MKKRRILRLFLMYFALSNAYYLLKPLIAFLTHDSSLTNDLTLLSNFFFGVGLLSAGFFVNRPKLQIVYVWAATTLILVPALTVANNADLTTALVSIQCVLLGLAYQSFNIHLCEQTKTDERGRVGAIIVSSALISTAILSSFSNSPIWPLAMPVLISLATFVTFLMHQNGESTNYGSKLLGRRDFALYLVAWLLICFDNNFLELSFRTVNIRFSQLYSMALLLKFAMSGAGALVGGILSDKIGRKSVLELSLMIMGAVSVLIGLVTIEPMYLLFQLISGFSWGAFLVIFYMILWGEFDFRHVGIYYSLGLSAYPLSIVAGKLLLSSLDISFELGIIISTALIFVSNILLIFAKETFTSQFKLTVDDLDKYIEKVKKKLGAVENVDKK